MGLEGPYASWQARIEAGLLSSDPAQQEALMALQSLWQDLESSSQLPTKQTPWWKIGFRSSEAPIIKGLYLYGEVGRGKSMLMDIFFDSLNRNDKRRVHFHAFMLEVHQWLKDWRLTQIESQAKTSKNNARSSKALDQASDPLPQLAKEIAKSIKILCFDEFHIKDIADAMILSRLFGALLKEDVIVVATSNQAPDQLYKDGLQREHLLPFIELVKAQLQVIQLDAKKDYRRSEGVASTNRADILFMKPKQAGIAIDHYLTQLFENQQDIEVKPFRLEYDGRRLDFHSAYIQADQPLVLRVNFDSLCSRPLGAVDYIALAKQFKEIIMEDIPLLTDQYRSPAKRFITLIDVLYEYKIALILNLPLQPNQNLEQLCQIKPLQDEFKRTASRLYEMILQDK